jgi:hypothetical protein
VPLSLRGVGLLLSGGLFRRFCRFCCFCWLRLSCLCLRPCRLCLSRFYLWRFSLRLSCFCLRFGGHSFSRSDFCLLLSDWFLRRFLNRLCLWFSSCFRCGDCFRLFLLSSSFLRRLRCFRIAILLVLFIFCHLISVFFKTALYYLLISLRFQISLILLSGGV